MQEQINDPGETSSELSSSIEEFAQLALECRPKLSIRYKLMMGFLLMFLFNAVASVTTLFLLNSLDNKLQWLVSADRYTSEIQQARRFEKNYFLYGSSVQLVLEHVERAQLILITSSAELEQVLGRQNLETMKSHLDQYKNQLEQLAILDRDIQTNSQEKEKIAGELRDHGQLMVSFALELSEEEHKNVRSMFTIAKRFPIVFLLVLLVLIVYISNFLSRQFLKPLNRLMGLIQRIAEGDFTPIMPARKYKDEFSNINMMLNKMMHELNQRQELMVQSHKLRAVGTLTAGIAHELNNPINNITLTAAMLEEDYKVLSDGERLEMIQDLVTQAERSASIVKNLLDFARESEIKVEHLNLKSLLDETLQFTQNQIKLGKVKVFTQFEEELPRIHGDKQQLCQVFVNIILNAVAAMEGKKGELRIIAQKSNTPGFVEARFIDNGPGIPAHIQKAIFDPFFTTKPEGKGHGLGLSVSLGIIEKHGGEIRFESKIGKGTTFIVVLPIAEIPAEMDHIKTKTNIYN